MDTRRACNYTRQLTPCKLGAVADIRQASPLELCLQLGDLRIVAGRQIEWDEVCMTPRELDSNGVAQAAALRSFPNYVLHTTAGVAAAWPELLDPSQSHRQGLEVLVVILPL